MTDSPTLAREAADELRKTLKRHRASVASHRRGAESLRAKGNPEAGTADSVADALEREADGIEALLTLVADRL